LELQKSQQVLETPKQPEDTTFSRTSIKPPVISSKDLLGNDINITEKEFMSYMEKAPSGKKKT